MRAKVTMTITTELDLDTLEPQHTIAIDDHDGLSEVSSDVLGALLIGALGSSRRAIRDRFPRAGQQERRVDAAAMVETFKTAWHAADARGESGERTLAGLTAVLEALR